MKKCVRCGKKKPFANFHKQKASADGYKHWCKLCTKEYDKEYKTKNQKKIRKQQIAYRQKNKEKLNLYRKKWGLDNPDKVAKNAKTHRLKYKDKINKKRKHKRKNNINFKLRTIISNRIRMALVRGSKNSSAYELTGCSWSDLKIYLEGRFVDGMTWDNYGTWHIDHIKPCCSFNLSKINEQKKCFHYSNLQPLWAIDNLKKSGK